MAHSEGSTSPKKDRQTGEVIDLEPLFRNNQQRKIDANVSDAALLKEKNKKKRTSWLLNRPLKRSWTKRGLITATLSWLMAMEPLSSMLQDRWADSTTGAPRWCEKMDALYEGNEEGKKSTAWRKDSVDAV